jgi:hypothetical protein
MAKKSTGKKKKGGKGKKESESKKKGKKKDEKVEQEEKPVDLSQTLGSLTEGCLVSDLVSISMDRLRTAPQDVVNDFLNPDTITHFIKAGVETYDVVLNIGPGGELPKDTKVRLYRIEKEVLMGIKAIMERRLETLDKRIDEEGEKCEPGKANSKLKEIKVED